MDSKASVQWQGGLEDGQGNITTESGVLDHSGYSFGTRFEGDSGTNPEELIAASHAACFSMALSMILGEAGFTADEINTDARVTLKQSDGGFDISASHLEVTARVPGATESDFMEAANTAKDNCPVSKVLKADISMNARLEG